MIQSIEGMGTEEVRARISWGMFVQGEISLPNDVVLQAR